MVCPDPTCADLSKFLEEATAAPGWDYVAVNATNTDPGAAMQQLIDAGVDYIGLTGSPIAQYQSQMDQAKEKGIPVFQSYVTDVPAGEENNLYSDGYDATAADRYARVVADWMIVDSGGAANVVAVTLGESPSSTRRSRQQRTSSPSTALNAASTFCPERSTISSRPPGPNWSCHTCSRTPTRTTCTSPTTAWRPDS